VIFGGMKKTDVPAGDHSLGTVRTEAEGCYDGRGI